MNGTGTQDSPFTHDDGDDRRFKWCRCWTCGVVARCEPNFDFYGRLCEPLRCEVCFRAELGRGVRLVGFQPFARG